MAKVMQTDEKPDINQPQNSEIQRDSDTPLPKKPSVLFIGSTLTIIVIFIIVVAMAYNGLVH